MKVGIAALGVAIFMFLKDFSVSLNRQNGFKVSRQGYDTFRRHN